MSATIAHIDYRMRYTSVVMNVTDTQSLIPRQLPGPPKELLSSNVFLLKRLGFAAKDSSHAAFEGTGLSAFHFAVLALLEEDPRETQAMIADALGYDRSHIVRLLDELEEQDLVMRKRDPEDRRRHVVKLTPEGRTMLRRLRATVQRLENEFFSPLDAEQRETLHTLLAALASHHDPRCALRDPAPSPQG
jgi:MarR family transcriptional regulator, lower aerobic nicotinate degradation pathway regulator